MQSVCATPNGWIFTAWKLNVQPRAVARKEILKERSQQAGCNPLSSWLKQKRLIYYTVHCTTLNQTLKRASHQYALTRFSVSINVFTSKWISQSSCVVFGVDTVGVSGLNTPVGHIKKRQCAYMADNSCGPRKHIQEPTALSMKEWLQLWLAFFASCLNLH